MITLITALCLFTTVNTDTSELQVQTVRSGSNVTIKCGHKMDSDSKTVFLAWYKQSLGKVPEYVVRLFGDERKPRFIQSFSNERFTLDEEEFGLIINGIKEEDAGTYFCGKVKQNAVEFESGTLLLFQAVKTDQHPVTEMVIKTGDSVTLQCSVESLTPDCSGDHSVYWFRHGSGESHPGIIYTHGNRSDECEKSSETDSPTQSCVYKLPTRNLSLSDAGTYYCAVAACGQILFGDQTKVTVQENNSWSFIISITLNVIFVIVIVALIGVLHKSRLNGASNSRSRHTDQADHTGLFNAVLSFAKRVKESQDLYSQVEYS
ncbi:uncharacterized protein LOC108416294 isoform X2 [Pygocentrus nattereri]|uniref:uncharacterized protein LOC108416294 isoform X1 n=1 Tax=Pygocentrus nattereri TaxID=42514 RepID=UPI0008145061|nr:uncharacterized protein LOC108416294 isoform X1 [Pygocentrus nattereri]XP_037390803.1 uncharacterized protein LOC108416294 isoform X2 [Pygocentrus nattereri]